MKQDLKRKLAREIELDEAWYDTDHLAAQLAPDAERTARRHGRGPAPELSPALCRTCCTPLGFVRQYQQL